MPTIKDIAKAAGVSHGTVSNVLNKTGKVSTEKIRRVEEAARRLGYVPNTQAQLLRQGAATEVAVILPSLREDTYRDFYLALQQLLRSNGFTTEVYLTDDIAAREERILASLPMAALAAVISVPSPGGQCRPLYDGLRCPVIFLNRQAEYYGGECACLRFDFARAGAEIGRYALTRKWRQIAFFSTEGDPVDESVIYGGFCAALAGSPASIRKITCDGYLMINRAFELLQEPSYDAIVTVGNLRADAVGSALRFLGGDMACEVLCIGNSQIFPKASVRMFELDYGAMAAKAADILVKRVRGQTPLPKEVVLPAKGFAFSFPRPVSTVSDTLSMLTLESPTTTALMEIAPSLQELTGLRLKVTAMSYDDLYAQIKLLGSDSGYDLVRMDTAWLDDMGRQTYLPLSNTGLLQMERVRAVIGRAHACYTRAGDILCALPFDPSVQILLYRRDLFDDAILRRAYYEQFREALCIPQTLEQWQRAARFFTRSFNPDSPTLYGATMTGGSAAVAVCDFLPYYLADGGHLCDGSGNALLNTTAMRAALARYAAMQDYANPQGQLWWRDSVRQFADGSAATVLTFSNHASYIMNGRYANIMEKTGAAMVPGGHPLLGGGVLGICRYTAKLNACCKFFDWFYHPDTAAAIVRLGGATPIEEAYSNYDNSSVFPWLGTMEENFAAGTRGAEGRYLPAFSAQNYERALGTAVYRMVHGGISPADAAALAQKLYDQPLIPR